MKSQEVVKATQNITDKQVINSTCNQNGSTTTQQNSNLSCNQNGSAMNKHNSNLTCLQKTSNVLTGNLEKAFYSIGVQIAKRPAVTIGVFVTTAVLCLTGLINFHRIDAFSPEWTDPKSEFIRDKNWVDKHFPTKTRVSSYLVQAKDNVLNPSTLLELNKIHHHITSKLKSTEDFNRHCAKVGKAEDAPCFSTGILELWEYNSDFIAESTEDDIKLTINTTTRSPVTNAPFDVNVVLGQMVRDDDGMIIGAKAALISYVMQGNRSITDDDDLITKWVEDWESEFISYGLEYEGQHISKIYVYSHRSVRDAVDTSIIDSMLRLGGGYLLLIIYVSLIFGKFSCVEQRIWLALATILGVGFSMAVSIGLSNAIGFGYSSINSVLPFLLLGLGVDDGFVIIQCWNQLSPKQKQLPVAQRAGIALKHAGVSITVTSVTDFIAFGVGASTVIPALRGFCIYAAIGILAVFLTQSSFLMACIVIDEKRKSAKRNACCACYRHGDDYKPNSCSEKQIQQSFFDRILGNILLKLPVKILIMMVSLGLLCVGVYGVIHLETEYNPYYYIPDDYHLNEFIDKRELYFPNMGYYVTGHIYLGDLDYYQDVNKLEDLVADIKSYRFINGVKIDFWIDGLKEWLKTTNCPWVRSHLNSTTNWPLDKKRFNMLLAPYVYMTTYGSRHMADIMFKDKVDVNAALANALNYTLNSTELQELEETLQSQSVLSSRIPFEYKELVSTRDKIKAMDESRELVLAYYPVDKAFSYSIVYNRWEADKIIQTELYRNLGLAFICICILTLLLLADLITCLLVSFCTLSSLIETGGFMYFWNIPIEMSSGVLLILAIGFAVDYSAHIGHKFMTVTGTRNGGWISSPFILERTRKAIGDMGPAVFNGGFSTFLAISLLWFAGSRMFRMFFKINFCVIIFGLWNGLVLLPVLLSWMGPKPYLSATESETESDIANDKESKLGIENGAYTDSDINISTNVVTFVEVKVELAAAVGESIWMSNTSQCPHNSPARISIKVQDQSAEFSSNQIVPN